MRSTWWTRAGRSAVVVALLTLATGATATAKPAPGRPAKRSGMNLFALTFGVMDVNRIFCGINNIGEICVDPNNSPVVGGGFWPKGTPDQYIFNTGLQLAGVIRFPGGKPAFTWAGDTTGAFFMDPRGSQAEGDPITLVYNSLDNADAAVWPPGAFVYDTAIYDTSLVKAAAGGLVGISQQDLWVRTWDGNPAFTGDARPHPMGILVEERGLAWNYPTGNEDIIYFIFTFYNVTARTPAVYSGLDPAIQTEIANIGADFQDRNEAKYNIAIPDGGYTIDSLYAAFFADMDVGDASFNYSNVTLPFNMGFAYKQNFLEPSWRFPANIFGPPFVPSPGFIGVKYLRSPTDSTGKQRGLTMFSNTLNQANSPAPDPVGVKQLFRYLSGTTSPAAGDQPCISSGQGNQLAKHYCYLSQLPSDTRFFQSSGPFKLNPGEAKTIVVAYIQAAPTAAVVPYIGGDFQPGLPATGAAIGADTTLVRPIERALGWITQKDTHDTLGNPVADGIIQQDEVKSVPRSLLDKALVAQAVFDGKFLLPFAPASPRYFLIPGDNQVTIAWQKSPTEDAVTGGDPYFAIASNPASTLYDPDFRKFDVEGYRIYRGRTTGDLALVAQFDYSGTQIVDYTGTFAYTTDIGNGPLPSDTFPDGKVACAPELGVQDDCPDTDPTTPGRQVFPAVPDANHSVAHKLVGDVVQIPAGGRVQLANGSVLILQSDTAVTGGGSGFPALSDNGVTFAYVDRSVRNSFTYYYAVTAFDVNSVRSGPSSLESPRKTTAVTPRAAGPNVSQTAVVAGVYGADGFKLDPTAQFPDIDTLTGTFKGNMPPANDGALVLGSAVVEALPLGDISVTIDSVSAGLMNGIGDPSTAYLTMKAATTTIKTSLAVPTPSITDDGSKPSLWQWSLSSALVPYDSAAAKLFGIQFTQDIRMPITFGASTYPMIFTSGGVGVATIRFGIGDQTGASAYLAHSRWFAAGSAEPPDPTIVAGPDSAHNAGALPGVSRIWAPVDYRDANINHRFRTYGYAQSSWYPADFLVTWNPDSSLTVFDSTNHGTLPYAPNGGTGWGFINVAAFTAAGLTAANLQQGDAVPTNINNVTYNHIYGTQASCIQRGIACITLGPKAQYEALDLNHDGAADANGIALMINGEAWLMAMPAIPAAGTKWRLRAVSGVMSAKCTPAIQPVMTDCASYTFTGSPVRPSYAPGLTYKITITSRYAVNTAVGGDLSRVHTVPDPYYVTNALEATANTKVLKFINLPSRAIVRIYSLSGVLVQVLTHNDQTGGGELQWNLRNRNNQFVASGVYFYHVETPDGKSKVGRFTVVNFAP